MAETPESRVRNKIRIKTKLIDFLGGKCKGCSENDMDMLQFDHIKDDGCKEKIWSNVRQTRTIYGIYAIFNKGEEEFLEKYQLLCANCNVKKEAVRRREVATRKRFSQQSL